MQSNLLNVYNDRELLQYLESSKTNNDEATPSFAHLLWANNFGPSDKVQAIYVYDSNNQLVNSYRHALAAFYSYPEDLYLSTDKESTEAICDFVRSDRRSLFLYGFFSEYLNKNIVRFVQKIYKSYDYSQLIGYEVCDVDADVFSKILEKYNRNSDSFVWLQEEGRLPIAVSGELTETKQSYYDTISSNIFMKTPPQETVLEKNQILFQASQTRNDLRVYSLVSQDFLESNTRSITTSSLVILFMMTIVVSIISMLFSRTITIPLEKLNQTIFGIRSGEINKRVTSMANDEIGQIAVSFNQMLDEMEDLIRREYEAQMRSKEAEYKALQAQINPHFLYNTLDTMSSIASVYECPKVSELSDRLSCIFRYSMDMKDPFATITQEINHLLNYLYIMDVRMNHDVSYQFDIDKSLQDYLIPRLSIQPIVENSLVHGLRNKRGEKLLTLTVKENGEDILIEVTDNGMGMDIEAMNANLAAATYNEPASGHSIGLANINARLQILFGDTYGLILLNAQPVGTCVQLRVPRQKKD